MLSLFALFCSTSCASEFGCLLQQQRHLEQVQFHWWDHPALSGLKMSHPEESLPLVLAQLRSNLEHKAELSDVGNINDLIPVLDDDFVPLLDTQHLDDIILFNSTRDRLQICIQHVEKRLHGETGDLKQLLDEAASDKAKHTACRKMQLSMEAFQHLTGLVHQGPRALLTGQGGTDKLDYSNLCDLKDSFDSDLAAYESLAPVDKVAPTCSSDQSVFETARCSWLRSKISTCITFDECVATAGLESLKSRIETNTLSRLAVRQNVEVIRCYLVAINEGSAPQCDSVPAPPPELYPLNLIIPEYTTCSDDADITDPLFPSTTNATACALWRDHEYPESSVLVPVLDCEHNCILPTTVPILPPPPAWCVNKPDPQQICPFYELHPDACGGFVDDATELCCACSGGHTTTTTTTVTTTTMTTVTTTTMTTVTTTTMTTVTTTTMTTVTTTTMTTVTTTTMTTVTTATTTTEACDVDGCMDRCTSKYGGSITSGDSYYCAKGCASMRGGHVISQTLYCDFPSSDRKAKCLERCEGASGGQDNINRCKFACDFWR